MKGLFPGAPGRKLFVALLCLVLFALGAYAKGAPDTAVPLYWYISQTSGEESYAARPEHVKIQDAKPNMLKKMVGYVYLSPQEGTVALYGAKRPNPPGPMEVRFVADKEYYQGLVDGPWEPYFPGNQAIAYVRTTAANSMLPAYRSVQNNVAYAQWKYRFAGPDLDQWKKLPNMDFDTKPSFYIWKDKPVPLVPTAEKKEVWIGGGSFYNIGNGSTDPANIMTGKGASPSKPLNLKTSQAIKCFGDECGFKLGFVITRSDTDGEVSVFASISSDTEKLPDGNPVVHSQYVKFGPGQKIVAAVFGDVRLAVGKTTAVTYKIEPFNKSYKAKNKSFTANVTLTNDGTMPVTGSGPAGPVDLKLRDALYDNGADANTINPASPYGTTKKVLTLYRSKAVKCDGGQCLFNLGFYAQRTNGAGEVPFLALADRGTINAIKGDQVKFAPGSQSMGLVRQVWLFNGTNEVTVRLIADNKFKETNMDNNKLTFTIEVKP